MKRTAIGPGLIASALLAGCSSPAQMEPRITDVSPGVVRQIGGAVFICDGTSCRLVVDANADADVNQDAVASRAATTSEPRRVIAD